MITIEHNVPIPSYVKKSEAWDIYKDFVDILEIGDSFAFPKDDEPDVDFATNVATFESDGAKKFVSSKETPYFYRVWRTA
jgi:hypothetical protein